jgi:membrane fusion protein (multidrug efflux system)
MVDSAKSDLAAAVAGVDQAKANLKSAQAAHEWALQQLKRKKDLYDQGAESKMALENAQANESTAAQAIEMAASGVSAAESLVHQKEAAIKVARSQLDQSRSMLSQADSRIHTARENAISARAGVDVARMQASATTAKIGSAQAHRAATQGEAQTSLAQNFNVSKLQADQKQALAKVDQARAALRTAEIDLSHAVILAPCDGRVSKRAIEIGSLVQVGTAMLYVVPTNSIFVMANFKETQVNKMREGDPVNIEIDGLPDTHIKGSVESLSPATGSTFALLPPDNASGNFVKVVQRVPVKIRIDQASLSDRLRVGLSVVVSVETK